MADREKIYMLIDKIPKIKTLFHKRSYGVFSTYNISEHKKINSTIETDIIFDVPEFKQWCDELFIELSDVKNDEFISATKRLLTNYLGWGDKNRFEKLESKLLVLRSSLDKYILDVEDIIADDERISESLLLEKTQKALVKLQKNHENYSFKDEDTMNDFIRDLLDESFEVKDQTRQGKSENGEKAGEIDIQICKDGLPVVMIECLILNSLVKKILDIHINKVLTLYDPNGCPYVVLLIYANVARFDYFWEKMLKYIGEYDYPYSKVGEIIDVETNYAELKHAHIILNRNGMKIRVHYFAAHMR